jgi:wyosine [tRNA(Phe)-imidazoG37] synthetase (radical SAM superfamily)
LKYIYGPVNSRRLGKSLGISIVPMKTCNYDCVFCELGKNVHKTDERDFFISVDEILDEMRGFFDNYKGRVDILTITGYGEPTLNKFLPEIAKAVKGNYPGYRLALLTNSTCLDSIAGSYGYFDVIMPTLSAISEDAFNRMNHPVEGINSARIMHNLMLLRENFKGSLELEIFICKGINDNVGEICLLMEAVRKIRPDRVWINTVDRKPAYKEAVSIDPDVAGNLNRMFNSFEDSDVKDDREKIRKILEISGDIMERK